MKYWWLEKYRNFKIIQINELSEDINYFLTMPKNYETQYQQIKEKEINNLMEEELIILLKKIVHTKNIKDNSLNVIISKLLQIPDNSFPTSDYDLKQMLEEIKNLKENKPTSDKLENNNIAVCYHCLNIFYIDKIKNVNKNNLCLCPYCLKTALYFDNDYIPMNYTFIKLANLYYYTSSLGCRFQEKRKVLRKGISFTEKKTDSTIEFSNIFMKEKVEPIDEKIIYRKLYQKLMAKEKEIVYDCSLSISTLPKKCTKLILELLIVVLLEVLSNTVYLKRVEIIFENKEQENQFLNLLKVIRQ